MAERPFDIVPGLARAATLPARAYTNPVVFELEREPGFRSTWQFAGPLDQLALPGNYLAVDVVGVPVVLTRDHDGTLRAFHNV